MGSSVVTTGDVDGDGTVELLISSAESALSARGGGAAWIVPAGATTHESTVNVMSAGVMITPPSDAPEDAYVGKSAVLCDLDGDGADEVVIGAPQPYAMAGMIGIFDSIPPADTDLDDADHLWTTSWGGRLGEQVVCGDFTGDGTADLATVMTDETEWRVPFAFRATDYADFGGASYLHAEGSVSDYVSLASVPSPDGTGPAALFVCFETVDAEEGQGVGYLVDGNFPPAATDLRDEARATLHGRSTSRAFCGQAAGSMDLTGDGDSDLVIGTWLDSGDGFGRVWVVPSAW